MRRMLTESSRFWQFTTLICSRQSHIFTEDVHNHADDAVVGVASRRSYLHDDEFRLGAADVLKLLPKTECDGGIRSRVLALLVELESWR